MKARIGLAVALTLVAGQLPFASAVHQSAGDQYTAIAVKHLEDNAADYDVAPGDLAELRVTSATRSDHTGVEHRYLRQQVQGIDVLTGDVSVAVMSDGEILHVGSRLLSDVAARASGSVRLDPVEAVRAAADALGLVQTAPLVTIGRSGGAERSTLVSHGGISRSPIPVQVVYQPAGDFLRLAWDLEIDEPFDDHWWSIRIDAENGRMLDKHDYYIHEDADHIGHAVSRPQGRHDVLPFEKVDGVDDGSAYRVYPLPYDSPNDGDRELVANPADPHASPHGWHDIDGQPGREYTITRGNNVHAFADLVGPANIPLVETSSSDGNLTFDHPIDFALPPYAWRDAAVTNLFYWNNITHDVLVHYGFDEFSGNFQERNYTNQGLGGDAVQANAQDTGGESNANFATPREGQSPRMQMYLWASTGKRQLRDGDLDAGIIIHEYGHGISIRLTGGSSNVGCLRTDPYEEQAGEGWSDWYAIAMTALPEEATMRRGLATYSAGQDARTDKGIRTSAYWTLNPSPRYDNIKTATAPHGVGWVWSAMLWDVMWNLVADHGFNENIYEPWDTGGNNLALQLVTDGLKFQPCGPGFVDSRNGILAADVALTGGENQCSIWRGFAKRGLGLSANQGSPTSKTDGTQAFDLPPEC